MNPIDFSHKPVIVVGGDSEALAIVKSLVSKGAQVTVVNPWFKEAFHQLPVSLKQTYGTADSIQSADYVFCASDDPAVNKSTADDAMHRNIPVWCLNDPARSTFTFTKGEDW